MSIPEPSVYLSYNVQAKQTQEKSKVNEQMYHIKKKSWNPLSGGETDQETSNCNMASVPCYRHLGLTKERKWGWVAWTALDSLLQSSGR